MRSPLGRAIGLGSAKEGVEHWWWQRISSIALVPLSLWFVDLGHRAGRRRPRHRRPCGSTIRSPAVLFVLLIATTFYHGALGLQVVIEDYVENEGAKFAALIVMKLAAFLLAALGIFSVLKLAFVVLEARTEPDGIQAPKESRQCLPPIRSPITNTTSSSSAPAAPDCARPWARRSKG